MYKINEKSKTFAIISHPDAGKTTLTEKLLLFGKIIQYAGMIKGKKGDRHPISDWMELEKQRGISITTSVMQFNYNNYNINILDTPGHEDFSEDTYRTLTAVDSVLMIIDAMKGVEERTMKLMHICRLRNIPIVTFINKLDRNASPPIDLLDDIEKKLTIKISPMNWPIGSGATFQGLWNLYSDDIMFFEKGHGHHIFKYKIENHVKFKDMIVDNGYNILKEEIDFIKEVSDKFDLQKYKQAKLSPVFFGTALGNFGIKEMLDIFIKYAPYPDYHKTDKRKVYADEKKFSGFVFKIQANMDRKHRDRIAFLRICSGIYKPGMKLKHVRLNRTIHITNALTFLARKREGLETLAYPGDIIGLHHGSLKIGDTLTEGEMINFKGIPHFSPEYFCQINLHNPLKMKSLLKGLNQLSEEGAIQIFRPLKNNNILIGAVGVLQFEVVAYRLKNEYNVECNYNKINIATSRWIMCNNKNKIDSFKKKYIEYIAMDNANYLTYLAPSNFHLDRIKKNNPDILFLMTREN